jgi:hypothetical protein
LILDNVMSINHKMEENPIQFHNAENSI